MDVETQSGSAPKSIAKLGFLRGEIARDYKSGLLKRLKLV
jgi:hypothetical protein